MLLCVFLSATASPPTDELTMPPTKWASLWHKIKMKYRESQEIQNQNELDPKYCALAAALEPMAQYLLQLYQTKLPKGAPSTDPHMSDSAASFFYQLARNVQIDPQTIYLRISEKSGYSCIPAHRLILVPQDSALTLTHVFLRGEFTPEDKEFLAQQAGCFYHELGHIYHEGTPEKTALRICALGSVCAFSAFTCYSLVQKLPLSNRTILKVIASLGAASFSKALWAQIGLYYENQADDAIPDNTLVLESTAKFFIQHEESNKAMLGKLYPLFAAWCVLFDEHPQSLRRAAKLEDRAHKIRALRAQMA